MRTAESLLASDLGYETKFVSLCRYRIGQRTKPSLMASRAREWLEKYPTAKAFAWQNAAMLSVKVHEGTDLCDWLDGNPNWFGKERILDAARELGCPIPHFSRLRDLMAFLGTARLVEPLHDCGAEFDPSCDRCARSVAREAR